ncbi:diguanylate cyclase [Massilia sp. PAMC28688]|uniref:ligand-binding sensor domain-containing diguanylate cyclase n=1 Tax=Massilia sp. PAMC28688 TaxID=2861283 RepID=UPI001C631E4C|nr:ligand-binding sensor domain-containing diguanylate cyclase [Massilia sp. PAMC28688]QYF93377.1 diguanylate cyclase [Massilia sp. PAMC28688]
MHVISFCRSLLLCAALLCGASAVHAVDPPGAYTFRSYGPDQGLINQAVTGLAQDNDGFIFASTEDGLFRYDGSRFERFGTDRGLLGDSIVGLYSEPGGRLWVLAAKGAMAWAGTAPDPTVKAIILPSLRIGSMSATARGHLVVATAHGVYEGQPDKLAPVAGLPKLDMAAVWISLDGKETLVMGHGVLYKRSGSGPWTERTLRPGLKNELVHTVMKDKQGRIWIRGLRFLRRLASFEGAEEDLSAQLPGSSVLKGQLVLDPQGKVWTPTNMGLARFDEAGVWTLADDDGLPTQSANAMLFDREGNLWISSEGVHRLQGRLAWSAHTRAQKLPSDTVWSVARSADGTMWVGTNRGLARGTGAGWTVVPGTEQRTIYTFAQDRDGVMWAGGNNPRAARNAVLMRSGDAFRSIPLDHLDGPSTINTMDFGPDGALYLGMQAHGLHKLVRDGAAFKGEKITLPNGEEKEQINQVLHDARGRLWVAGMGGLAFYNGKTWRRFGMADGLRDTHVEALAVDQSGDLLVSYWNVHGLTRFTTNEHGVLKATQVDQPAELVADNIYSLGYAADGALWLGTAQGVKRLKDGRMQQFGRGEGLPSEDAAANAFWPDPNGDVWFGMASGLAHYHAAAAVGAPPLPTTEVLRVEDGAGKTLTDPVPQVGWANRALTFRFAALSFTNESRVHPQVRLVGFEDAWRDTDIREARYTGLPPGPYRFEVRASIGGQDYGPVSMREVVIMTPWWRTWWAMAGAAVVAVAMLLLILRWRTGYLRRRNVELENLVRARTDALEQANEALHVASMVDPLTGLKNRRFLGLTMPDELARVNRQYREHDHSRAAVNKTLLIFMVDLDHFKAVNDTYGHAAGDLVLQQASSALRRACRDADFVVRWGGEEFLIVARNSDRDYAELLARNLREAVRELRIDIGNGIVLQKTCSIGFSAYPVLESDPAAYAWEDAVKMADQCLYVAKHSGRDAWVGVVLPPDAPDPGPRIGRELGALVSEGKVPALHSLGSDRSLRWTVS